MQAVKRVCIFRKIEIADFDSHVGKMQENYNILFGKEFEVNFETNFLQPRLLASILRIIISFYLVFCKKIIVA